MHVSGLFINLELPLILQFLLTVLLLGLGLHYLVKNTASRYLIAGRFEEEGTARGGELSGDRMLEQSDGSCHVCGRPGKKQCSQCKAVRYCSTTCQSEHWKADHKLKCKQLKVSKDVDQCSASNIAFRRRTTSGSLVPGSGFCKVLREPKEVLFPYDEFVKLYNWDKPGLPPCGLLNCGNSCFANVVLQCLACTKPLIAYLVEKGHTNECIRNDWCFLCELQVHVHKVRQSLHPFSPINILSRIPNIGGNLGYGKQEDAHEFMRFAIDAMQAACLDEFGGEKALDPSTQETTLIQHIFGGHLQSQVICTKCNQVSNRYENMMDLTVEIQGDAESLEECLDQFTVKEWLDGENMYKCDGCNDYVKAWKRLTVHQAPNVLTIALKRFQTGRFGKLNKRVTFPETLDLGPYMSIAGEGTDLYRLYAVVVHVDMLNASFFGHYICYTKDLCGNWYRIDDCKVMKVELEEVLSQRAYMLLYSRIYVRQPFVKSLKPVREDLEEPNLLILNQEARQCPENSDVSLRSPLSDVNLNSLNSVHEGELDVDVNSNPIREQDADTGLSHLRPTGLEKWDANTCSQKPDDSTGDGNTCPKELENACTSTFIQASCEPEPMETDEPCFNSDLHSGPAENNGPGSSFHEKFNLPESSFDVSLSEKNPIICNVDNTSDSISILNPAPECLEPKPNCVAGLLDSRSEKKVESSDLPGSEDGGIGPSLAFPANGVAKTTASKSCGENSVIGPNLAFPANGVAKTTASKSRGENSVSGRHKTAVFTRGFLDKPPGKKSSRNNEKSQNGFGEATYLCNGFETASQESS